MKETIIGEVIQKNVPMQKNMVEQRMWAEYSNK